MSKSIKVGIFVLMGLVLVGIVVFMIGENKNLWDSKITYQAAFNDVAGLKPGAPVRMGGVDVGAVSSVGHSSKVDDPRIYVTMSVVRSESTRVREDTIARVVNKGLLGDKMIELSSEGTLAQLDPKKTLKTEEPLDISKYVTKLEDIANKAGAAVDNIEKGTRPFSDPQFSDDIKQSVHSLREILDGLAHKDSVAHRLILDPNEGRKLDVAMTNFAAMSDDLRDLTSQVQKGPGIAHALVYDGEMAGNAAGSLDEVHKDLTAIREGNGLAHALLYGDTQTQHLMGNVNTMSDDLKDIVRNMKQGKGTLGALLVDPTLYEDIRAVVGNVDRNQVLRALVRYSIKADEQKPAVKVDK